MQFQLKAHISVWGIDCWQTLAKHCDWPEKNQLNYWQIGSERSCWKINFFLALRLAARLIILTKTWPGISEFIVIKFFLAVFCVAQHERQEFISLKIRFSLWSSRVNNFAFFARCLFTSFIFFFFTKIEFAQFGGGSFFVCCSWNSLKSVLFGLSYNRWWSFVSDINWKTGEPRKLSNIHYNLCD